MKWGRWIGAGVGFVSGGPIGSILGLGVGSVFDKLREDGVFDRLRRVYASNVYTSEADANDFVVSMLVLASTIVKADNRVDDFEMSYVRTFLADQFGAEFVSDYIFIMEEVMKKDFEVKEVAEQIRRHVDIESRLQMLHFLFGIANADFKVDPAEMAILKEIGIHLGIPSEDFVSIRAMFQNEMDAHYQILEIRPSASDAEVKSAYRTMTKKYHPDKVMHLGEGVQKAAKQKFAKVQEAYDAIKRDRGMK